MENDSHTLPSAYNKKYKAKGAKQKAENKRKTLKYKVAGKASSKKQKTNKTDCNKKNKQIKHQKVEP